MPRLKSEYRAVLQLEEKVLGPEHPNTLKARNNLANALAYQGKSAEAEAGVSRRYSNSKEKCSVQSILTR